MTFQNPQLLILLVLLLPAALFIRKTYGKSERVLISLKEEARGLGRRSRAATVLSLVLLASLLVVSAGPRRYVVGPDESRSGSFVFLVDASRSMAARSACGDPMPLDRARALMAEIVTRIPAAAFSFTAFTELTFPLSELSHDRQYLLEIIENGVFTEVVPVPGSDVNNAIHVVLEKKLEAPPIYQAVDHVILLSDGDLPEDVLKDLDQALSGLRDANIKLTSIGVGGDEALPIPTIDDRGVCLEGRYERSEGREFYTHLFEEPLRYIAGETGGRYFHVSERDAILDHLRSHLKERPGYRPPVQTADVSYIFLVTATLSLFGLVALQRP